jgi:hypothetical protein
VGRPVRDLTKEGPFGRLTPFESVGRKYGGNTYWLCRCECGEIKPVKGSHLTGGNVQSCGCLARETCAITGHANGGKNKTHGASGSPTFNSWKAMMARCNDTSHPGYLDYGGRGISVCEGWLSYDGFRADMGDRPENTTLNRKNNDGPYDQSNCNWATNREQALNTSRNVWIDFDGRSQTIIEWAEELGMSPKTIWSRMNVLGWSVEQTLTQPVHGRN